MPIQKVVESVNVFVKDRWGARKDYLSTKKFTLFNAISSLVSGLVFPPLSTVFGGMQLIRALYFLGEYTPKVKADHYKLELQPLLTAKHYFSVGYEMSEEELQDHLNVLKSKATKILAMKQKNALTKERWRLVGIDKDTLTRHFIILGTTGAGKTSFLMVIFEKHMAQGGGLIFVDGKAEEEMFKKLYSLAKANGREKDVYLINFLNTEEYKEDTNTFNPLLTLPPVQIVAFLSSLMGEAGGDQSYWQGRGKALLRPLVFFYYTRKKFWNELYSYENIQSGLEAKETTLLGIIAYVLAKSLEEKLQSDNAVKRLYEEGSKKATATSDFPYMQILRSYFIRNPAKIQEFESLGYKADYLEALFKVYTLFRGYFTSVKQTWWGAVGGLANLYYDYLSKTTSIEDLSIEDLRSKFEKDFLQELKRQNGENKNEELENWIKIYEDPNILGDALEQHGYASQQWTDIFSQIEVYSHIFGSTNPDIDFVDVIKNNKILYVLLPAMKSDQATVSLLGKMVVLAIKQACSVALGGKVEMTRAEKKIFKSRITPKPLGLVVLDEYGAYPVSGIDVIFAQVRSLNISFLVSVQDYASLRAEGKDENSAKRAWANSSKIIFLIKDEETLSKLREYIKKRYITKFGTKYYNTSEQIQTSDVAIEQVDEFDPRQILSYQYGLGVAIVDRPVVFQSFWADAEVPKQIELVRFEEVE